MFTHKQQEQLYAIACVLPLLLILLCIATYLQVANSTKQLLIMSAVTASAYQMIKATLKI